MKIKRLLVVLAASLLLTSCAAEFKLANTFVSQSHHTQVAVYFPEEAEVTLIQDADGTYTEVLDSVNQNMFLDIMYAAYAEELNQYGLEVYIPENQDEIPVDSTHWLVLLSKMEIQGFFSEYEDYLYDITDEYSYKYTLNTVNVASWFDINNGEWLPTLYDEHNLMDDFNSYVTRSLKDGVQYHYNIKPIKADDVYSYAMFLGKRYARFTFDNMMNRYIDSGMTKQNKKARFKLHWSPRDQLYEFMEEGDDFIEIE